MKNAVEHIDFTSAVDRHKESVRAAEQCKQWRLSNLRDLVASQEKRLQEAKKLVDELPVNIVDWRSQIAELEAMTDEELMDKIADLARTSP